MKISRERIAEARDLFPLPLSTKPPIWHCRCSQCKAGVDLLAAIDERDEQISWLINRLKTHDLYGADSIAIEAGVTMLRGSRFEVK